MQKLQTNPKVSEWALLAAVALQRTTNQIQKIPEFELLSSDHKLCQ